MNKKNMIMRLMKNISILALILGVVLCCSQKKSSDYLSKSWKYVATKMPSEWYGSDEAKLVAENVLLAQKEIGGWEKNKPYHKKFSASERAHYVNDKAEIGATFDNNATITELRFLAKVYSHFNDERYKKAFEKGLNYIFISQYKNGGWPQFYPVRKGHVAYSGHITYNDDAMVNTMNFLNEIFSGKEDYASLQISKGTKEKARKSYEKGIQCILNTQIVKDGKATVWCAQYDEITLAPANARSYELSSYSGSESVGIVQLLMDIKTPSKKVIASVKGAISWFESHKIEGIRIDREVSTNGKKNKVVVKDPKSEPLWARFYDLKTEKPFFCSRDGIKRNSLSEISDNRRNGYGWYTNAPEKVLKRYPVWESKKVN